MASNYIKLPSTVPAAGEVNSFNGRTGVVLPASGDYTASQVTFVPAGTISATNVQAAIEEVASESGNVVGPASATTLAFARFDGTTGKLLKNSLGTMSDNGAVALAPNADAVQWKLTANATQTNLLSRWENSALTLLASVGPTGFIGVGPNVPKAALHVSANTTSGTVGTGALILGLCSTTQNVGAGSVIMGGQAGSNYSAAVNTLVGGVNTYAVSTADNSIFWGTNSGSDSAGFNSIVVGENCRNRGSHALLAGFAMEADFGAQYLFGLGRSGIAGATGASILTDGLANSVTNSLANSLVSRFSAGFRRCKTALTSASPIEQTVQDIVSTTDATVTTLQSFTTASDTNYLVESRVNARRTGGTAGAAGDAAGYIIRSLVKNIAGTVTVNGLALSVIYEDQVLWDASIDASGTAFRIRVTGAVNNNVTWTTTTVMTIL